MLDQPLRFKLSTGLTSQMSMDKLAMWDACNPTYGCNMEPINRIQCIMSRIIWKALSVNTASTDFYMQLPHAQNQYQ